MTDSERQEAAPGDDAGADAASQDRRPAGAGRGAIVLAVLALLIAAGAAAAAGWLWYQGERRLAAQGERLATVERSLESSVQDLVLPRLKAMEDELAQLAQRGEARGEALAGLRERVEDTRLQISELSELVEGGRRHWRLLEIESLLLAANERLQLYRDPRGARAALILANRRLGALDDPRLFEVRERVVDEIAALEALPDADIEGLALNLAELIERVPDLPLASDVPGDYAGNGGTDDGAPGFRERPWRHFLDTVSGALRGMLTIRRTEEAHQPLMPPEQEYFLYQNLLLKLESARLALLRRDTPSFRNAVATAREWLRTYFDADSPRVASALETLNGMRKVELAWEAPDISDSLTALRDIMRRRDASPSAGGDGAPDTTDANDGES